MPGAGNTASSPVSMPVAEAHMAVRPLMGELSLTVACIPGSFQMKKVCSRRGGGGDGRSNVAAGLKT